MLGLDMIDEAEFEKASGSPIALDLTPEDETHYAAPWFVDYVKEWFLSNPHFGETPQDRYDLLFEGGLKIVTTVDLRLQRAAERAIAQAHRTRRPLRGLDGDRPQDRLRAGHGRWPRLLERGRRLRAHQPRDRRRHRSTGRVGVQAVRARRGARTRDSEDAAAERLHGAHPAAGRDVLGAAQRRGRRLRDDLAGERHRQLGQRRVREPALADRGRRSLRGRRRARGGRRADGHPVLPPHHRAERPARGGARGRPGRERGEHARDGFRVRHARDLGGHVQPSP